MSIIKVKITINYFVYVIKKINIRGIKYGEKKIHDFCTISFDVINFI